MISCKAPCKVNVSLRVLGKRPDGFHEVDTVMVPLDLCDVLEFSPAACLEMSCDAPGVPLDESNLVMKAGTAEWSGNWEGPCRGMSAW